MTGKLGALIFVDGVSDVRIGTLHVDLAAASSDAAFGDMAASALRDYGGWRCWCGTEATLLGRG